MTKINPYINFPGTCEEAFNMYKSIFGGDFTYVGRYSEMPDDPNYPVAEADKNKIMHISLPFTEDNVLMGSDSPGDWKEQLNAGNNITISITADSKNDADRFFNELSAGGKVTMPMNQTFWGDYFGMCTDQFNINWMISFNENPGNN